MDSIRIDTGEKRIAINDDPERVIIFNPSDVFWVERFQGMKKEVIKRFDDFSKRAEELELNDEKDENKIEEIEKERNELRREWCVYTRLLIDNIFGEGTSQKAFGDLMSEYAILSFFEGITPFIEIERSKKIEKYTNKLTEKKNKHKK
jgi:hypothetical protein